MEIDNFNQRRNASWLWEFVVGAIWVLIIAGIFTGILLCVKGQ